MQGVVSQNKLSIKYIDSNLFITLIAVKLGELCSCNSNFQPDVRTFTPNFSRNFEKTC